MTIELSFRELTLLNCAAIERILEQNDSLTILSGHGRNKKPVFVVSKLQPAEVKQEQGPEGELITDTILDKKAFVSNTEEENYFGGLL